MTQKEAIEYIKGRGDIKVYEFQNGWLFMDNQENPVHNMVIPCETSRACEDRENLCKRLAEWLEGLIEYVEDEDIPEFPKRMGWRIKTSVEPIFTNDYLLSTQLEKEL